MKLRKPFNKIFRIILTAALISVVFGQIKEPEIFPFNNKNMILLHSAGGFNFDNDEFLEVVGIAAKVDKQGTPISGSTFIVLLELSVSNDFNLVWKFENPKDYRGDFTSICVTDMDNDNRFEFCASYNAIESFTEKSPAWLYIFEYGAGGEEIQPITLSQSGAVPFRLRPQFLGTGDFNSDGADDLIISSGSPARCISVLTSKGELSSENLDFAYQNSELDILGGILPFRCFMTELDTFPGTEILVLGGQNDFKAAVIHNDSTHSVIEYNFDKIPRNEVAVDKIVNGDLDGDGYSEALIPLRHGGMQLLYLKDSGINSSYLFPKDILIESVTVMDKNRNGLDEIIFHEPNKTEVIEYEFNLSGTITDFNAYDRSVLINHLLGNMKYLTIEPVYSNTLHNTGAVVIPFYNPHYDQHGVCFWQIEEESDLSQPTIVDEVLDEISGALEKVDSTATVVGEQPVFAEMDALLQQYTGLEGSETQIAPILTESQLAAATAKLQRPTPDVVAHVAEKSIKNIEIPGLSLDNLQDFHFNVNTPEGMIFNLAHQRFEWVPLNSQLGLHDVSGSFFWGNDEFNRSFTVYVNDPPKITSVIKKRDVVQIGETFRTKINYEDKNDDCIIDYKLIEFPAGATITENGEITWKPTFNQADWFDFIVEVSDGFDANRVEFSLFVNHPVSVESRASDLVTAGNIYEYQSLVLDKNQGGFMPGYQVSPRIENWQQCVIYETTILDGAARNNLAAYTERINRLIAIGAYETSQLVEVLSEDGTLILHFSGNQIPDASTAIKQFFDALQLSLPRYTKPEQKYVYNFFIKDAPVGMNLTPEGQFTWIPSNRQFDRQTLAYTVSDGFFTAEEHAQIYVNHPPSIVSTPPTEVYVNEVWEYDINATDLNTDSKLNYQLIMAPAGAVVSAQGIVTWQPTKEQINDQHFQVKVTDGMAEITQDIDLYINVKPRFVSTPKPVAIIGLNYEYQIEAEDLNRDEFTFNVLKLPRNAEFDPETNILSWKPKKNQKGITTVSIEVVDIHGASTVQDFDVHVFQAPGKKRNVLLYIISAASIAGIAYLLVM